jgi:hypothetical protein
MAGLPVLTRWDIAGIRWALRQDTTGFFADVTDRLEAA